MASSVDIPCGMGLGKVAEAVLKAQALMLVTAFGVIGLLYATVSHIPGIGWRFFMILDSPHGDY